MFSTEMCALSAISWEYVVLHVKLSKLSKQNFVKFQTPEMLADLWFFNENSFPFCSYKNYNYYSQQCFRNKVFS